MSGSTIRLTKHHGLGNDFLVWIGGDEGRGSGLARRWCDRHRGIGADGLLLANMRPDGAWRMILFNADGSRAEMSGNGIRCFAQAVGNSRPGIYRVVTDAGERLVDVTSTDDPSVVQASVAMGSPVAGTPSSFWEAVGVHPDRPVAHIDMGNPHTVVGVDDVAAVNLQQIGSQVPDVNLEIVMPGPEPEGITMRVHERGAGITEACGTGACASAWAAVQWGLVPSSVWEVLVHMDGGDATVRLNSPAPGQVTLVGPSAYIATISVDL
jgi:diaminopimelate epimerase